MKDDHLMQTYARLPVAFVRGQGAWLWDDQGKRYLDALSGIAVCGLGHAHPVIAAALADQARLLVHTSNLYEVPLQQALAATLTSLAGMDRAFFCNSGAEANEAAIKLARLAGHGRGVTEPVIAVADNSFHGRTLATLSATGNRKVQAGFEPLVQGFVRVPFGDIAALEKVLRSQGNVVAVLLEPVQGEGGVRIPPTDYLPAVRALCDQTGTLLMLDEVQTGIGRTGNWFASQGVNCLPDVMTLAKGLGNGVPIGACLARGDAARVLTPGTHGSTFGGNPVVCRAALETLRIMREQQLPQRAAELGRRLLTEFTEGLAHCPGVVEVRGSGLLLGIELDRPCGELVGAALEQGLLINVAAGNVVRLLPPLILDDEQARQLVSGVIGLVRGFLAAD